MKKKRPVQILIIVAIVIIITGIWIAKSIGNDTNSIDNETNLEITEVDLAEIMSTELPVIIDFGSDSCGPCREMAPALEAVYEEVMGKAIIHFVDVWKYPEAVGDFPIQLIPTQIFITSDGEPFVPSEGLNIEFTMYADSDTGEHIYTIHEGALTESEMKFILMDMGADLY